MDFSSSAVFSERSTVGRSSKRRARRLGTPTRGERHAFGGETRGERRRSRADARALDGDDGVSRILPATRDDDDGDDDAST